MAELKKKHAMPLDEPRLEMLSLVGFFNPMNHICASVRIIGFVYCG